MFSLNYELFISFSKLSVSLSRIFISLILLLPWLFWFTRLSSTIVSSCWVLLIFIFIFWISPVAAFLFFLAVFSCSFNWSFMFSIVLEPCFYDSALRFASSYCSFLDWKAVSRFYKSYLSKSNFYSNLSRFILFWCTCLIKFSMSFSPSSIYFLRFLISDCLIVCSFFISFIFFVIFSNYLLFSCECFCWFFSISS